MSGVRDEIPDLAARAVRGCSGVMLAARNPGYVQLVYPPYRIEMSLTLVRVSPLVAAFVLVYLLVRLVVATLTFAAICAHLPRRERAPAKGARR